MAERFNGNLQGDQGPVVEDDERTRYLHDLHVSEGCPLVRPVISANEAAAVFGKLEPEGASDVASLTMPATEA